MKVAMLEAPHRIVMQEMDGLRPGPAEVLIRTKFAGVCGSDLHTFKGVHPFRKPPVVLGHEVAGTITEVGKDAAGFRVGDRVTVMPVVSCGTCRHCRAGDEHICPDKRVPGIRGWVGSFAEYFLADASVTYKLATGTPFETGALAEPLAVAVHSVFRRGRVRAGDRVLILGAGTIGILTAFAARMAGASDIVVTDVFDFNLRLARDLAGAQGHNAKQPELEAAILAQQPEKFDVTFLCSSAAVTVAQAFTLTRRGGRIVVTGLFHAPIPTDLNGISLNEFEVVGSVIYTHEDFKRAVEWVDTKGDMLRRVITHTLPLERAQEALELLADHPQDVGKILLEVGK